MRELRYAATARPHAMRPVMRARTLPHLELALACSRMQIHAQTHACRHTHTRTQTRARARAHGCACANAHSRARGCPTTCAHVLAQTGAPARTRTHFCGCRIVGYHGSGALRRTVTSSSSTRTASTNGSTSNGIPRSVPKKKSFPHKFSGTSRAAV